jgi:hypothetical protein
MNCTGRNGVLVCLSAISSATTEVQRLQHQTNAVIPIYRQHSQNSILAPKSGNLLMAKSEKLSNCIEVLQTLDCDIYHKFCDV